MSTACLLHMAARSSATAGACGLLSVWKRNPQFRVRDRTANGKREKNGLSLSCEHAQPAPGPATTTWSQRLRPRRQERHHTIQNTIQCSGLSECPCPLTSERHFGSSVNVIVRRRSLLTACRPRSARVHIRHPSAHSDMRRVRSRGLHITHAHVTVSARIAAGWLQLLDSRSDGQPAPGALLAARCSMPKCATKSARASLAGTAVGRPLADASVLGSPDGPAGPRRPACLQRAPGSASAAARPRAPGPRPILTRRLQRGLVSTGCH
jgi:hypothetical protein